MRTGSADGRGSRFGEMPRRELRPSGSGCGSGERDLRSGIKPQQRGVLNERSLRSIRRFETGLRGSSSLSPWTTSFSLRRSLTNWVSIMWRGAGRGRIRRTRSSSRAASELNLAHAKLTAFGSTRFARNPVEEDRNVRALVEAGTPVSFHFRQVLGSACEARSWAFPKTENLKLISETVRLPQGARERGRLRRGALLRRLSRQPGVCAAHAGSGARGGGRRPVPVRHQRRHGSQPVG